MNHNSKLLGTTQSVKHNPLIKNSSKNIILDFIVTGFCLNLFQGNGSVVSLNKQTALMAWQAPTTHVVLTIVSVKTINHRPLNLYFPILGS